jgi:phosphatidylserine synthase
VNGVLNYCLRLQNIFSYFRGGGVILNYNKGMNKIPVILIYSRLLLGFSILLLSILQMEYYNVIAIIFFTTGLLTDIFDGIIARRLNVSSEQLRRLEGKRSNGIN